MSTFFTFMGDDHDRCDQLYADAEQAVADGAWASAEIAGGAFLAAMARHFAMEEQVLFPAFEQASGNAMGPTRVMRWEHEQMRGLFEQMRAALAARHRDDFLGAGETLLVLMQQHNMKEEQILYPMTDHLLADARNDLLGRMQALEAA